MSSPSCTIILISHSSNSMVSLPLSGSKLAEGSTSCVSCRSAVTMKHPGSQFYLPAKRPSLRPHHTHSASHAALGSPGPICPAHSDITVKTPGVGWCTLSEPSWGPLAGSHWILWSTRMSAAKALWSSFSEWGKQSTEAVTCPRSHISMAV